MRDIKKVTQAMPNKTNASFLNSESSASLNAETKDFGRVTFEVYSRIAENLGTTHIANNMVPQRMKDFAVTNDSLSFSDEANIKNEIAKRIAMVTKELIDNDGDNGFLKKIGHVNINDINIERIAYDSILIDNNISAEKVAEVYGSFKKELYSVDISKLLDISSYSISELINAVLGFVLLKNEALSADGMTINYFTLLPYLICAALSIYNKISETINPDLYPLLYFIINQKGICAGISRGELVEKYLNEELKVPNDITDMEKQNIIRNIQNNIDALIKSEIIAATNIGTDEVLVLATEIKTKEIKIEP